MNSTAFRSFLTLFALLFCFQVVCAAETAEVSAPGDARILSGADSRPWCYYWWLKGNVSEELLTADLEEMAAKGFGGVLLFDSRGYWDDANTTRHVPVPLTIKYEFMSPEWRKLVTHVVKEAHRLGMQVSMNIANTGGQLRGPWDLGADGPKELIWTEQNINGPKRVEIQLTDPAEERFFQDVALMGVRITSPVNAEGREAVKLNEKWQKTFNPDPKGASATDLTDLRAFVKEVNGTRTLVWDVPAGAWKVLRFGSRVIGDVGSVDVLNRAAVTRYFGLMCEQILADVGPELAGKGKTLTHFYNVSWEGSDPNWTEGFAERFQAEHGYAVFTKLPAFCGVNLVSFEDSCRFCEDFNKTVSNAFRENCYLTIGALCRERGMVWHSEDGGPWSRGKQAWMGNFRLFTEGDMLAFWGQNDVIQGEFWVKEPQKMTDAPYEWPLTRSNARYASMAAHVYNKKLVAMESFTHMVHHYTMFPAHLKPAADENFTDGANWLVWHTYTASPKELGKPGFEYFAGTHINKNVTWWNQAGGFLRYIANCQKLLRKGQFVADACVYTSDKTYIGWGHGETWTPGSKLVGGDGWKSDLIDSASLIGRLTWNDAEKRLVLPHGMNYKILVIDPMPEEAIPVEALEKAVAMVEAGAVLVLGENVPARNPGLKEQKDRDARLAAVRARLWTPETAAAPSCRTFGKGRVYRLTPMNDVLVAEKILPDFESEAPAHYAHYADAEADRYFVAGSGQMDCVFRAAGAPVIYDPLTDREFPAMAFRALPDGRTRVTLALPVNGSAFVIFPKGSDAAKVPHFETVEACAPEVRDWLGSDEKGGTFRFWNRVEPLALNADWTVRFAENLGAPAGDVAFSTLQPWNLNAVPGIRFFSGTARYTKRFTLTTEQAKQAVRLALGKVAHVATVRLNGKEVATLWTAPWTADLSGLVQPGENTLEIDVTNTWQNRLIGDAALPKEERVTKTNLYLLPEKNEFKPYQGFFATDPLMESGLIGPVEVQFGVDVRKEFKR